MVIETRLKLVEIVEKASTLSERRSGGFVPEDHIDEDMRSEIEAKLQRWCHNATRGNWEKFKTRLAWDDLDIDTARRILGPMRIADDQQLPNWIHTLDEVLRSITSPQTAEDRCLDQAIPIPFEELWLPFVRVARRRLKRQADATCGVLSDEAFATLERELLRTLSIVGSQCLYVEFAVFRALRQPTTLTDFMRQAGPDNSINQVEDKPARHHYIDYIQHMFEGGFSDFFHEYCVVGRLASLAIDHWVGSTIDFLNRLSTDLPDIQSHFGIDVPLGQVVDVTPGLSDPHSYGQFVIALRFESGFRLIYKPRDIGIEAAYNALLDWINQKGVTSSLKALNVLNRSTHGWVEFVEHLPCQNEDEAALYYHRAGMLIGLVYVLHGSDCHHGNLIACGPHPVIIDLEVLLHPMIAEEIHDDDQDSAQLLAMQQYQGSVLTSGLLPMWSQTPDGKAYDVSGFGARAVAISIQTPHWSSVNTDQMTVVRQKRVMPESSAVAYLNQTGLSPNDYVDELVAGFQQIYGFLRDHRAALLASDGPISAFKHLRTRFVFRNTALYDKLRQHALAPRSMKDGAERSIVFEMGSLALVSSESKPRFWPILKEEIRALEQMDVPMFSLYTDEDAIITDTNHIVVENVFVDMGYHLTINRVEHLNETDMELQSSFIRASIYTTLDTDTHRQVHTDEYRLDLDQLTPLTQAQLVEKAAAIADRLLKGAIRTGTGMTWITTEYNVELQRHQLKPLGHSLYSGLSGIALFFGALAQATGEKSYRDMALAALHEVRADLARQDINRAARLGTRLGLGSAYGIGAVIYAFTRLSQFLNDEELTAEAKQAATWLTSSLIANDQCPDVFSGSAGAILGLLTLYNRCLDQSLLDQALICGQHLLDTRVASASGYRAWATLENLMLTGLSHGAAGIAYALLRLYEQAPDPRFLNAAREAIAYECSVFSPVAGNWPDFRPSETEEPAFTASWCHGAPGIALARLGTLKLLDAEEIRHDIGVALETTQRVLLTNHAVDHLCCGTLGRAETLFKAGHVLNRPDLTEMAFKVAANVAGAAEWRGSYYLFAGLPTGIENPGFFQGYSGIGYQFLRFAYPDVFPSVLLWE